jgi:hypothetical protein
MQAIKIDYPASRCPCRVRRINPVGHRLFMQPEHMHNHLRLCLSSRRFYELTEMLGMQPKLLCPRRSRFAPIAHKWEIPNHKHQITNQFGSDPESYLLEGVCKRAELVVK